jgi:hypothetical protein
LYVADEEEDLDFWIRVRMKFVFEFKVDHWMHLLPTNILEIALPVPTRGIQLGELALTVYESREMGSLNL